MNAQWRKLQVSKFSKECCPAATRPPSVVVHSGNLGNACCSVLRINPNLLGTGEFRASRQHILHWRYKRRLDCALKNTLEDRAWTGVREGWPTACSSWPMAGLAATTPRAACCA